jgi:hypothetical protein
MKHTMMLTLIVLCLLLSGNKSASAASNQARLIQHKEAAGKQSKAAQQRQPEPTVPLSVYKATESALLEALVQIRAQQEAAPKQHRAQYEPLYAPAVLAQFCLILVGVAYTIVSWRQLRSIRAQSEIAAASANAATKSARAAELALNVERPYVFVESQQLSFSPRQPVPPPPYLVTGVPPPESPQPSEMNIDVSFILRNYGKGVALLQAVHTELVLTRGMFGHLEKPIRASKDRSQMLERRILGPSDYVLRQVFGLTLPVGTWNEIKARNLGLCVVGVVRYQDVFRRINRTWFCFDYWAPTAGVEAFGLPAIEAQLWVGREKHNRYT